jgi:FixJ family two-component response regulator
MCWTKVQYPFIMKVDRGERTTQLVIRAMTKIATTSAIESHEKRSRRDQRGAIEIEPVVLVVDGDARFRRSTERLIRSAGLQVQSFASATDFLRAKRPDGPACVVLEVRLPGLSGLDLQHEMARVGMQIPIIFVTGHGDIPMTVKAMKAGAIEFLTKPFQEQDLFAAIEQALRRDRAERNEQVKLALLRQHYDSLTPREREVMKFVVSGLLNKQIAGELGTTEKTIKFHRAHVMRKMEAPSLAALVQMAARLQNTVPDVGSPIL